MKEKVVGGDPAMYTASDLGEPMPRCPRRWDRDDTWWLARCAAFLGTMVALGVITKDWGALVFLLVLFGGFELILMDAQGHV